MFCPNEQCSPISVTTESEIEQRTANYLYLQLSTCALSNYAMKSTEFGMWLIPFRTSNLRVVQANRV